MKKPRTRTFAVVLAAVLMVTGLASTAYAAINQRTIDVSGGAKIFIDGEELIPRDSAGTVVDTFVYNGTNYLPARAISEALGGTVEWNQDTNSAYITSSREDNPNMAIRVAPEDEHYIFEISENVTRTHVYYKNRFGIEIAADLYMAKDADITQRYPAVVIGPPFGGVKEQGPGVYANQLAQRGFVVLAFDPAYHGYSGGEPRMNGSTALYVEDFSAAVDYLGVQPFVDREKIGAIGICGSGGFSLSAAAMDTRIKAVIPVVMYDIAGNMNSMQGENRQQMLEQMSQQRWVDFESGTAAYRESYPKEPVAYEPLGENYTTQDEWFNFYATTRGHHPNALANVTSASMADIMNFPSSTHINEIAPRPILFVVGENAHSRSFSDAAYANVSEPKELYVAPNANHIDLYDDVDKIPFDKIETFLKEAFTNN